MVSSSVYSSTPTGLLWYTNMSSVSLFRKWKLSIPVSSKPITANQIKKLNNNNQHHHHYLHQQPYLVKVILNRRADKRMAFISGSYWNLEYWFLWKEEKRSARRSRRKTSEQGWETLNLWRRVRETNPGHSGGRWALSLLRHSCIPSLGS